MAGLLVDLLVVLLYSTTSVNGCDENINATRGYLQSPNYPSPYPSNAHCTFVFTVPVGFTVGITWLAYSLEGCPYDYLTVYDGPDSSYPQLAQYCVSTLSANTILRSTNNTITAILVSDSSVNWAGFRAYIEAEQISGCGGYLDSNNGTVTSPGYPNRYVHMLECTWVINVTMGYNITLVFTDLDMEDSHICAFDSITIYDGPDATSPEVDFYCGRSLPEPNMVNATSNFITIVMVSDGRVNGRGFAFDYGIGTGTSNAIIVTTPADSHAVGLTSGAAMLTFLALHLVMLLF